MIVPSVAAVVIAAIVWTGIAIAGWHPLTEALARIFGASTLSRIAADVIAVLMFAALAAGFGPRVAELVGAVTNPEYAPGRDPHEQYREHVAESLRGNPWARVIKASDFTGQGVGELGQPAVGRRRDLEYGQAASLEFRPD